MFKRILIPTDGSARSRKAANAAIAFAKAVGAEVTAYHAIELVLPFVGGEFGLTDPNLLETVDKTARQQADKWVTEIAKAAQAAGVSGEGYVTRPVMPHQGIIDAAKRKKCDVIFIASHGRSAAASLILGSVTQRVLAHSKLPVLVYR